MATGKVKWFNDSKGFGFITPDEGGEDLFAHHTELNMQGFITLVENQKIQYEIKMGPKGKMAANITVLP
jgi:CspA family cold shock protein